VEFCGPWVQPGERISTHTVAEWGDINTVFETDVLINTRGNNFIIAHLRVGKLQIALGQQIRVVPLPGISVCYCVHDMIILMFQCVEMIFANLMNLVSRLNLYLYSYTH